MAEILEISKGVQDVMKTQSETGRLSMMLSLYEAGALGFRELLSNTESRLGASMPVSTFSHSLKELTAKGLVAHERKQDSQLSPFGKEAVEAFWEYRQTVLPVLITARVQEADNQMGIKGLEGKFKIELMEIDPKSYHPEPALLEVMSNQSGLYKMRILASLSAVEGHNRSFTDLLEAAKELNKGRKAPNSTISNDVTDLERGLLVKRVSRKLVALTSLGEVSVEAFSAYQDRLRSSWSKVVEQRLVRDFGISIRI